MPTLVATITATLLVGCSKMNTSAAKVSPTTTVSLELPQPFLGFVALDYDKPGHPLLTDAERATIHDVLAKAKPCQRPLIRYSITGGNPSIAVFFAVGPHEGAHVFGTNEVYDPTDAIELPMSDNQYADQMVNQGAKWDIDHEPCRSLHSK
jgi:hypothetical protein